jgi:acetylornithine deacetylase/succinyl-diaminopimelate desuccinylase-like protein
MLADSGLRSVQLLEVEGAHPAVYGEIPGPDGAPTVLLYAHHDVQPPGPADQWDAAPFEPFERNGRLFGRGAADDKAGIVLHLASIRALGDDLPVTIKVFIEGEEEIGSTHLVDFLNQYTELLSSDAIIIGDAGNWRVGTPTLTTSLRGLVDCTVTVRTLKYAVHSGSFGGTYPDANSVLARVLASLHNDNGTVAVEGLVEYESDPLDLTVEELADQMLPVDGLELIGKGSLTSRLWTQPSISVLAIDSVPISEAINQLVPDASAKVSLRIAPGQDPSAAMNALVAHIEASVPWGAEVTVERGALGSAIALETNGAAYDAYREGMRAGYSTEPVEAGMGGSIPFVAAFSEIYPDAAVLLIGVADPTSRYHGPNESVELADVVSGAIAQSIALAQLGV